MTPERAFFWKIEGVWLFYTAAFLAVGLFLIGVAAYIYVWLKSTPKYKIIFSRQALKQTLLDTFLGLRVFKGDLSAGIMHSALFWGFVILFIGTCLLMIHEYLYSFLKGKNHLLFEVSMEVGGLVLLAGIIWALVRRYVQRVSRLERRLEDGLVPLGLLMVVLSGFALEALRLASQKPAWGHWSFAGAWAAGFISDSAAESVYPYFWWGHALLSLGFIAVIPFTKLFHMVGGPAALFLHHSENGSKEAALLSEEQNDAWNMGDVVFFDACMRCGRCAQACPSTGAGEPFTPRDFIQATRKALWQEHSPKGDIRFLTHNREIDRLAAWYCTTCAACLEVCPIYGAAFKFTAKKRTALIIEGKEVPDLMNQTLERVFHYENPWVSSKRERGVWAKGLDVPALSPGGEGAPLCYFVGCTTSFDARAQGIAKSFSAILKRSRVRFGILGEKEPCCGDLPRVVGETGLFQEKMENCGILFEKNHIEEVVTSSPHCFHTFLNEYAGRAFRVRHYVSVLKELIADGRLQLKKPMKFFVTYHDPCYLGRHNRIFDEPREIIRAIPDIQLVEMAHHGSDSLCCGAGGGRMWQGNELHGEARMSEIRIREAHATGAEILITACPLCLIMLEDALKTLGLENKLRIMDLNELVLEALE